VLDRAVVCRDEIGVIVRDLNELRRTHDLVFTSGGVGPTHDDVTLPAIAQAFGRVLTRAPQIEALIREHHGERVTEDHLRMADVPEGARFIANDDVPWPTVAIENVYIFPGVPEIFRLKFAVLRAQLNQGQRFYSRAVLTMCDEGEIAAQLSSVAEQHPQLFIGSYPRFRATDYRLKVTVDGPDEAQVAHALEQIVAFLPRDKIVRVE
jgi:molybdopterin-biosynthesis enzyme MoeA-like protein